MTWPVPPEISTLQGLKNKKSTRIIPCSAVPSIFKIDDTCFTFLGHVGDSSRRRTPERRQIYSTWETGGKGKCVVDEGLFPKFKNPGIGYLHNTGHLEALF